MNTARNHTTGTRVQTRTKVPVVSRTIGQKAPRAPRQPANRIDVAGYVILIVASIMALLLTSVPLNNYYAGRAEIARLNDAIVAKQAEKDRLLSDIEKFKSDSYIEQEARRRLGVVAPGETAFRILDPRMQHANSVTTDKEAEANSRLWYEVLWDSVSVPPTESATAPAAGASSVPHAENAPDAAPAGEQGGAQDGAQPPAGEPAPPAGMETQP